MQEIWKWLYKFRGSSKPFDLFGSYKSTAFTGTKPFWFVLKVLTHSVSCHLCAPHRFRCSDSGHSTFEVHYYVREFEQFYPPYPYCPTIHYGYCEPHYVHDTLLKPSSNITSRTQSSCTGKAATHFAESSARRLTTNKRQCEWYGKPTKLQPFELKHFRGLINSVYYQKNKLRHILSPTKIL